MNSQRRNGFSCCEFVAFFLGFLALLSYPSLTHAAEPDPLLSVGVAQTDITPPFPVRLHGFGFRREESEGVTQRIWAKALAFAPPESDPTLGPALVITTDNLGVPFTLVQQVASRLAQRIGLKPERLSITATHTHTAPMLKGVAPTLFGMPIPAEHQGRIDQYTAQFAAALEHVAISAVSNMQPSRVFWSIGSVDLARNRRNPGGPVDHDLPVMRVESTNGTVRALYTSYACHCVTLSNNKISGDWAGYAQESIQRRFPGAIALMSVGCGADSNPASGVTGDNTAVCSAQGDKIAEEVARLVAGRMQRLTEAPRTRLTQVVLPLAAERSKSEWQERAKRADAVGHHARVQLERLQAGQALMTQIVYPLQTWTFGDDLALVFMPGEVVVDYALRLKREFDRSRLWINAYANDAPCYIPSERILKEGGYEGGDAMVYYDVPQSFAPGVESLIINALHGLLPTTWKAPPGTEGTTPKNPTQALRTFQLPPNLLIEPVATEPLVADPVAIDWDASGRLWVVEMHDYPMGLDGQWKPGGRLKVLEDQDADGRYDHVQILSTNLAFPTGVLAWQDGALVCAAPDIWNIQDPNHDGIPDSTTSLMHGFAADNYQARVNGLSLGLDGWIHAANGLLGGQIQAPTSKVDIRGHDFRFTRDFTRLETVSGLSQQGRVRSDWGDWFGCDNSTSLQHYPIDQRHLARNPHVTQRESSHYVPAYPESSHIFPISRLMERFNDLDQANRITSGCGLGLYRDTRLGWGDALHAFVCEPVHNVVHREVLTRQGPLFTSQRASHEQKSEFLSSTDTWFRPVQVRTGPDGFLYVVDMYRFLIEHPRWIAPQRLARLDPRAGSDLGRIYRIRPAGEPRQVGPVPNLKRRTTLDLARALDHPNGTERDRIHLELLSRPDLGSTRPILQRLTMAARSPAARVQALALWNDPVYPAKPSASELVPVLQTSQAEVRLAALRILDVNRINPLPAELQSVIRSMAADPDASVRFQVMLMLGDDASPEAGALLADWIPEARTNVWWKSGWLSSIVPHAAGLLPTLLGQGEVSAELAGAVMATALGTGTPRPALLGQILSVSTNAQDLPSNTTLGFLAPLLPKNEQGDFDGSGLDSSLQQRLTQILDRVSTQAFTPDAPNTVTLSRIPLMGWLPQNISRDVLHLVDLAQTSVDPAVQAALWKRLRETRSMEVARQLIARWDSFTPSTRTASLQLLLSREAWTSLLLDAVQSNSIPASAIPLSDQQRLLQTSREGLRSAALKAFPVNADPKTSIDLPAYLTAVTGSHPGSAAAGQLLFQQHCATCHRVGSEGHEVGPDLALLRAREPEFWIQNILVPNAVVEPRFVSYEVELKDGRSLTGILTAETPVSVTIVQPGGIRESLRRSDLTHLRALKLSLMPEGLASALPPTAMADLLVFLRSGVTSKSFPGHQPTLTKASSDSSVLLHARHAEIFGGAIAFETEFGNIGMWHGEHDHITWSFELIQAGPYDVHLDFACAKGSEGNRFLLSFSQGGSLAGQVPSTGAWNSYQHRKIGTLQLSPGRQSLRVAVQAPLKQALMDLRTVALVPAGHTVRWPQPSLPTITPQDLPSDGVPRTPAAWARLILDASLPHSGRETAIAANPQFGADLILEMTRDLPIATSPVEYDRIPWIWRIAIAAGKRNDPHQIARILHVSLPKPNEPLRDWQAVVLGGGIINGLSQRNLWPSNRLAEILVQTQREFPDLQSRLEGTLKSAEAMANDSKVHSGTRYDALRILGVGSWSQSREVLMRYLRNKENDELEMGAVSGLGDISHADARKALKEAVTEGRLNAENQKIAQALLERPW